MQRSERGHWVPTAIAMTLILVLYGSWQLFDWGPSTQRPLTADFFFYVMAGAAVLTAWGASRRVHTPKLRRAWRLFALGLAGQLSGQIAFMVYSLLGKTPYPSFADVLYLSFYPLVLAGLLSLPVAPGDTRRRLRLAVDLAVVTIGSSAVVIYVVLGPTVVANSGSPLQVGFSVAYPAGDMVLLVGISSLLLRGSAPSARWSLRLLALGLVLFVLGDVVYGYMTLHSSYQVGDPIDATWMVALALMAVAGTVQRSVEAPERIDARQDRSGWLPSLAVALGFGILLFSYRHGPVFPGLVLIMIAIALAGLVLARQVLVQHDLLGAQAQLRHQALHDVLTGLPNRALVLDRAEQMLARARRQQTPVAAMYIDVDGFKHINDTFGHAAGDDLLKLVAARLSGVLREGDTVGRIGGDEFVALLDSATLAVAPELVAERILEVLRHPVEMSGPGKRPLSVTASIGLAVGSRATADELLRDADLALYRAKELGKDRYSFFEANMQTIAEDRVTLEMDLHEAIEEGQLFLLYQPTFDLQTQTMTGVEALIRWHHPRRGLVMPDQFIPIAERTGMIVPIGRWVLETACQQAAHWHRCGNPIGMAVNVSGRQLERDQFVTEVRDALAESGLDASTLTLDITETTLMRHPDAATGMLTRLKTLGVRVAIDDFGTGYSSLAYLRQFPVDVLKIDRAFISGIAASKDSAALIHTLVQLGKTLGLETLGEGIEDPAQLKTLQREQCDLGQGFLFARPLDAEAIEQLFELAGSPVRPTLSARSVDARS